MGASHLHAGRTSALWALIAIAATWGLIFAPMKIALAEVSPEVFLQLRLLSALLFLLPLMGWRMYRGGGGAYRNFLSADLPLGVIAGVVLFLVFWLQLTGLSLSTPSKAGFITGMTVAFVPLLYALLHRKRPQAYVIVAVAASFAGLTLASVNNYSALASDDITHGDALLLTATLFNALHIILMGAAARRTDSIMFNTIQIVTMATIATLIVPLEAMNLFTYSTKTIVVALITGFFAIGILLVVQVWAQKYVSPVMAGLTFTLEPLFAALGGIFLLGEVISLRQGLGFALIFAAMIAVQLRQKKLQILPD